MNIVRWMSHFMWLNILIYIYLFLLISLLVIVKDINLYKLLLIYLIRYLHKPFDLHFKFFNVKSISKKPANLIYIYSTRTEEEYLQIVQGII